MKKIFSILIILLIILVTFIGGWLIYKKGDFSFAQSAGQVPRWWQWTSER